MSGKSAPSNSLSPLQSNQQLLDKIRKIAVITGKITSFSSSLFFFIIRKFFPKMYPIWETILLVILYCCIIILYQNRLYASYSIAYCYLPSHSMTFYTQIHFNLIQLDNHSYQQRLIIEQMQFIEEAAEEGFSDDEQVEIKENPENLQLMMEQRINKQNRVKRLLKKLQEYEQNPNATREDDDEEEEEDVPFPSKNDPNVGSLKCIPQFWKVPVKREFWRHENEVVLELTLKKRQFMLDEIESSVTAIIFKNQGEIIIEALFERDVVMLIRNCFMVYMSRQLLEPYEVASIFKKQNKNIQVQVGQFARIKSHKLYGGDLCKVLSIKSKTMCANVKLIEREQTKNGQRGKKIGVKTKKMPNTKEIFNQQSQFYYEQDLKKERRNARHDGFFMLAVAISNLQIENLNLQEEELKYFYPDVSNLKEIMMQIHKQFHKTTNNIQVGEQAKVQGMNKLVTVKQLYDDGDYEIELRQKDKTYKWKVESHLLSKAFKKYQNVWIQQGPYKGFEGTIMNLNEITATVHVWEGNLNVELHLSTLGTSKATKNENLLHKFKMYDLVRVEDSQFGCVLNVVHDKLIILNSHNDIEEVSIKNCVQLSSYNNYAMVQDQQAVKVGDYIKIDKGHYGGMVGTVLHCYRDCIYILSKYKVILEKAENCKVFVKYTRRIGGKEEMKKEKLVGRRAMVGRGMWRGYKGVIRRVVENRCLVELDCRSVKVQCLVSELEVE